MDLDYSNSNLSSSLTQKAKVERFLWSGEALYNVKIAHYLFSTFFLPKIKDLS